MSSLSDISKRAPRPQTQVIRLGQNLTNPFAAMIDDKSAMRPFAKLLGYLFVLDFQVNVIVLNI